MKMKKLIFILILGFLSEFIWGQCYLTVASYSGIENLYSAELDSAACDLISEINELKPNKLIENRNSSFIIFSYDLYHFSQYKLNENSLENQIETITQELSENYDYYLGVIKHIKDEKIEYSITMDVSGYEIFSDFTESDFKKLEREIAQIMNLTYIKENQNIPSEKAGINYFKGIISGLQSGIFYSEESSETILLNKSLINEYWVTKTQAWFVSLAGIPLYLPSGTWVQFANGNIKRGVGSVFPSIYAEGMILKFKIGEKNYGGCFDSNTGDFKGYYTNCIDSTTLYKFAEGDLGNGKQEFKSFTNPNFVVFATVQGNCQGLHIAEYKYDCPWSDPHKRASGVHKTREDVRTKFIEEIRLEKITVIEPGYQPETYIQKVTEYVARNISYIPNPCIGNFTEQELNVLLESSIVFFKEIEGKIYPLIPTKEGHLTYWDDNNLTRHYFVYHKTLGWRPIDIEKYDEAAVIINTLIELGSKMTLWGIRAASVVIPVVGTYSGATLLTVLALETSLSVAAFAIHQDENELYIDVFLPIGGLGAAKLFKTLDLIQTGKNVANIPTSGSFQSLQKSANDVLINSPTAEFKTFGKLKEEFPKTITESGGLTKAQKWEKFLEDLDVIRDGSHNYSMLFSVNGIKAWEGLINIPTLRKNIDWLTRSSKWIDEGAEFVTTNGVTKLKKGADEILEIKNEKILPSKYSSTGTAVGEPSNGYQVVKNGNELAVKRVPKTGGYDPQDLAQLSGPNAHPNCHVLERHGHDVTDDALIKRATTRPSVAPDGSTMNNPPDYSSKFDSPEKVVEGMNNTKQGTPAWNAGQQQGSRRVVEYESSNIVGKGVPRDGNSFVTTKKVFAVYEDTGGGTYKLITMYPSF